MTRLDTVRRRLPQIVYIDDPKAPYLTAPRPRVRLVVPLAPEVEVTMFVAAPMTEGEWDQMQRVLTAMKPGLISGTESES